MPEPLQAQAQQQVPLLLRICIGGVCLVFLLVLIFGRIFEGIGVMDFISSYYYSPTMHTVFVGGLCILATLLICYRYMAVNTLASFLAGICAIGVALFPTAPTCPVTRPHCVSDVQLGIGNAHYVFAGLFLATIAFMALVLFTLSDKDPYHPENAREIGSWWYVVV
jgi:hypothetical protein